MNKSLVVGLPYSSIFWQFWAVFILTLAVILLMVVQGGEACLSMTPSCLEVSLNFYHCKNTDQSTTQLTLENKNTLL